MDNPIRLLSRYWPLLFLIALQLTLSGCFATYGALQKVEPPKKLLRYDSVCVSQKKELMFNFRVWLKETQKEETWCAKVPMDKIIDSSTEINQAVPWNSPASEAFYNSLNPVSAWNYTVMKTGCSCSDLDKIPYHEFGIGYLGQETYTGKKLHLLNLFLPNRIREKWIMAI